MSCSAQEKHEAECGMPYLQGNGINICNEIAGSGSRVLFISGDKPEQAYSMAAYADDAAAVLALAGWDQEPLVGDSFAGGHLFPVQDKTVYPYINQWLREDV